MNKELVKELIAKHKDAILKDITGFIKIPSVTGDKSIPEALQYGLDIAKRDGYETKTIDGGDKGLSGHFHHGPTDKFIGILGHVDVVPVNPAEWSFDPWGGEIVGDYITGRGTQDDKGPMVMCQWAVNIIKEMNLPITKGVRFIYGTQEEGGNWSDIEHYFTVEDAPYCGFTPDADFPITAAEKGIFRYSIIGKGNGGFELTGGTVVNSVPGKAHLDGKEFIGKPCHAKDAPNGDNAIWKALAAAPQDDPAVKFLMDTFVGDAKGKKAGIYNENALEGGLTCNLGTIDMKKDGSFEAHIDIRWPDGNSHKAIDEKLTALCEAAGFKGDNYIGTDPVFHAEDSELVKALYGAYKDVTGDNTPLSTTGGGTYARAMKNCCAFGPLFPDDARTLHEVDEQAHIPNTLKAIEIYVHGIYNLIK